MLSGQFLHDREGASVQLIFWCIILCHREAGLGSWSVAVSKLGPLDYSIQGVQGLIISVAWQIHQPHALIITLSFPLACQLPRPRHLQQLLHVKSYTIPTTTNSPLGASFTKMLLNALSRPKT